ncbi:MAG: WD40/YVTN/BNR-like repeat-containing protein [Phycisphaerales bacterium]
MTTAQWSRVAVLGAILSLGASTADIAQAQQWQEFGPAPISNVSYSGRVSAIAASQKDANLIFIGAADGGVWRTTDGGVNWVPLTDHMPTTSIGALALHPTNEDIIYAGTGEANYANHSRYGLGLYKSTDGGDTWQQLAESTFAGRCFSKLIIDPQQPNVMYASITRAGGFPELAAAKMHPDAQGLIGVFKSTDSGVSWQHLSNGLPNLSATDLALDPANTSNLYAAIGRIFGHADNGIYKSTNGGASWTRLSNGLPTTNVGRTTVAIAPSDPQRLYAMFVNPASPTGGGASTKGAFRSDDGGASWTAIPLGSIQASYGWYLSVISVKPDDPNTAIFGGLSLRRTTDAGSSFATITPPHVDLHALAWDAAGRLIAGDDGGVHRSPNIGSTWGDLNDTLGTIQFYAGLSTHPTNPDIVFGGTQDNGSNRRTDNSPLWQHVFGGDGGWTQLDQQNPQRVFVESQGTGNLYVSTNGGSSFSGSSGGISGGDRNCFLPPYLINPLDSSRMLYATQRIYRSTNGGSSWSAISADLSNGSGAIRAIAQSPTDPNVVYAATNDGNVAVSFDEGQTFTQVLSNQPGWPRVTRELWVSATDPMRVYLAGAAFGVDQVRRSDDAGQTWTSLDGNLPDVPVNVIAENHLVAGQIFAGSDSGLYFTNDDGQTWELYGSGLPRAVIIDIRIDYQFGRILVGTQGRGSWAALLRPLPAELTGFDITFGTLMQGDLAALIAADGNTMRIRSQFGFTSSEPNLVELRATGQTSITEPQNLTLIVQGRLNNPNGRVRVRLRNINTQRFDQIGEYTLGTQTLLAMFDDVPAADYVDGSDTIEVSVRQSVIATFSVSGFVSTFDALQIAVE